MKMGRIAFPEQNQIGRRLSLLGDSVPKPLGFTAFPTEWQVCLGRLRRPATLRALPHSGRWIGARVASLRCPILRPGETQYKSGSAKKEENSCRKCQR